MDWLIKIGYYTIFCDNIFSVVGTGPVGWVITPSQEPLFGKEKGARPDELPMAQVAEYLEILQEMGYKIAASHSMVSGENNTHKIISWTMQGI